MSFQNSPYIPRYSYQRSSMCCSGKKKKSYLRVEAPPRMILGHTSSQGSNQMLISSCGRKGCDCDEPGNALRKSFCAGPCCKYFAGLNTKVLIALFVGSLLLLFMALKFSEWGAQQLVYSRMVLKEGSDTEEMWTNGEPPVTYSAYIFNITNPEEFQNGGRPRVVERGPYVYRLQERKENVVFNDNGTVTYNGRPFYTFLPHLSIGPEDDIVTTVNVPLVNAGEKIRNSAIKHSIFMTAQKLYDFQSLKRVSVGNLLWGHRSKVLDWARSFSKVPYPHDKFGLMMGRNDTLQPPYNVNTGSNSIFNVKTVHKFNNSKHMNIWNGDFCNQVRGSDMSGFHPMVQKDEVLHIFNGQICRSLPLIYNKTVIHSGLETYRYIIPPACFAYGEQRSKNRCYCSEGGCPPRGVLDMRPCYFGAAVAFSFPHFYQGHPSLRHMVLGLRPDPEKHATQFDIFPSLGVPMRVKLRMQMNVVLDENQALDRARHFNMIFPIFWFEAGIDSLPSEVVGKLKMAQNIPPLVKSTSVAICGILTLAFFILLIAHTVMSWCGRLSPNTTRSSSPDGLPNPYIPPLPNRWNLNPDTMTSSYKSSEIASTIDNQSSANMQLPADGGTILPPYRRHPGRDSRLDEPDYPSHPPPYVTQEEPFSTTSTTSAEIHNSRSDEDLSAISPLSPSKQPTAPSQDTFNRSTFEDDDPIYGAAGAAAYTTCEDIPPADVFDDSPPIGFEEVSNPSPTHYCSTAPRKPKADELPPLESDL